jgi:hypothetical protein
MKGDDLSQRATQALQPFRHLGTPVEDEGVAAARRQDLLPLIGGSIRAVSARRSRWRRARYALAIAAAAAGVVLGIAQIYRGPAHGERAVLSSGVAASITRHGRPLAASDQPRLLVAGDRIATRADAPVTIVLVRGARAQVGPSTSIALLRDEAREQRLKLEVGQVKLEVPKLAPGGAFVVETPQAEVRVRGTRFKVEVSGVGSGAGITRVGVTRGSVVVRTARGEQLLAGGESWSSPLAAAKESAHPDDVAAASVARASATDEPEAARAESSRDVGIQHSDERREAPVAARSSKPASRAAEAPPAGGDSPTGSTGSRSAAREPGADANALAQQNRLLQAALAARSQGDHARAVRLLDELLRRYPSSPLAESARVERFRSLRRLGRHSEATREARRYLASYGHGFARDEARGLVLEPDTGRGSAPKR